MSPSDHALLLLAVGRRGQRPQSSTPVKVPRGWIKWVPKHRDDVPDLPKGTRVAVYLRYYDKEGSTVRFSDTHNARDNHHSYSWAHNGGASNIMYYKVLS